MRGRGDGTLMSAGKVPDRFGFAVQENSGVIGFGSSVEGVKDRQPILKQAIEWI